MKLSVAEAIDERLHLGPPTGFRLLSHHQRRKLMWPQKAHSWRGPLVIPSEDLGQAGKRLRGLLQVGVTEII